jgi:hypothetical protein
MRGHHDMGGEPAGPVENTEHDYAPWEKRVDALLVLLSDRERSLIKTDELRRNIESIGPDAYHKMSYYERWITSLTTTLLQRGAITTDELGRKLAEVEKREKDSLL